MSGKFRFPVKTAVMFVAAVLYIVLIADWCVPGYGLHLAAVVLGGHGQVETPLSWFSPWGLLVHFIGWDVRGLGVLSAFGALCCVGLVSFIAEHILKAALNRARRLELTPYEFLPQDVPVATALTALAFVLTPGFLRAATTVDPILPLLAVFLTGLAILIRLYIDPKVRARYERLQREALERDEISPRAREFIGDQLLNIDIALNDWVRAEVDAIDVLRFNRRHLRANAVMGTINGVRGNTAGLQVMLTNLRRIAGLSKTHQKEVEVLGK